jgi:hypothetical protein
MDAGPQLRTRVGFDAPRAFRYPQGMARSLLAVVLVVLGGCSDEVQPTFPDAIADLGDSPDTTAEPDSHSLDLQGSDSAEPPDDATSADAAEADIALPTTCPDLPCDPGELCVEGACVCDPAPVSFSKDVAPLLETGCGPGCHVYNNPATGSAGLNLDSAHSWRDLVDAPAFQCGERRRVVPGDIRASYLMDKMLGRNLCSGNRMPRGRSYWEADRLDPLGRWICQGARND